MQEERDYLKMTVESGVAPLELKYCGIYGCYSKKPVAFRTSTQVNSIILGTLTPSEYSFVTDNTDRGIKLATWSMLEAMSHINKCLSQGKDIDWISVRCPVNMATTTDMYEFVGKIIEDNKFEHPEKLCLEFSQSILFEEEAKARLSILDMKLLKVRTLMSGCASDFCPTEKLMAIPFDTVLIDPKMTVLVNDRNKDKVINSLIAYIRSMRIEVIGEGVLNDDQIRALNRADCMGYIPSVKYVGNEPHGSDSMSFDEAVNLIVND